MITKEQLLKKYQDYCKLQAIEYPLISMGWCYDMTILKAIDDTKIETIEKFEKILDNVWDNLPDNHQDIIYKIKGELNKLKEKKE